MTRPRSELFNSAVKIVQCLDAIDKVGNLAGEIVRDYLRVSEALAAILKDPYGCPFCDSGKLRNPAKNHSENCGYYLAQDDEREGGQ